MRPQTPNRAERATGRERDILLDALARECPECGLPPGTWCFRASGVWTLHATRILGAR